MTQGQSPRPKIVDDFDEFYRRPQNPAPAAPPPPPPPPPPSAPPPDYTGRSVEVTGVDNDDIDRQREIMAIGPNANAERAVYGRTRQIEDKRLALAPVLERQPKFLDLDMAMVGKDEESPIPYAVPVTAANPAQPRSASSRGVAEAALGVGNVKEGFSGIFGGKKSRRLRKKRKSKTKKLRKKSHKTKGNKRRKRKRTRRR